MSISKILNHFHTFMANGDYDLNQPAYYPITMGRKRQMNYNPLSVLKDFLDDGNAKFISTLLTGSYSYPDDKKQLASILVNVANLPKALTAQAMKRQIRETAFTMITGAAYPQDNVLSGFREDDYQHRGAKARWLTRVLLTAIWLETQNSDKCQKMMGDLFAGLNGKSPIIHADSTLLDLLSAIDKLNASIPDDFKFEKTPQPERAMVDPLSKYVSNKSTNGLSHFTLKTVCGFLQFFAIDYEQAVLMMLEFNADYALLHIGDRWFVGYIKTDDNDQSIAVAAENTFNLRTIWLSREHRGNVVRMGNRVFTAKDGQLAEFKKSGFVPYGPIKTAEY